MPECAEVKITAEYLNLVVNDKILIDARVNSGKFLKKLPQNWNVISDCIFESSKTQFKNIKSLGKFIYGEIHKNGKIYYLSNTLGMSGFWTNQNLKHNHITLEFSDKTKIYFNDVRRFGNFNIITHDELNKKLDSLGIDFFGKYFVQEFNSNRIQSRLNKCKDKQICEVLMNQSIFCGVGNYIKNEVLFKVGIHPATLLKNISDLEITQIVFECHEIIKLAYKLKGASFRNFKNEQGEKDGLMSNEFEVYGKTKTKKGFEIKKQVFNDKRTSFYCSELQMFKINK
jgi:formamidopyrimidine-DNA glycosylase